MKYLDNVKVIKVSKNYENDKINLGDEGTIIEPMIRDNTFYVIFENDPNGKWYKYCAIKIQDLELVKDNKTTNEEILESLPKHNPKWWCKVEDGYIMNLLGEKKNKIPYDYDS